MQDQSNTIQNLQKSPTPQTSNWSGTFFSVFYSKRALDLWQFRITILVYRQNLIIPDIAHSDMLSVSLVAVKI